MVGPVLMPLVGPPGWAAAWSPRCRGRGRRPPSAPVHMLRRYGCTECDFQIGFVYFSFSDIPCNVLVCLLLSCIVGTFCHFGWTSLCCTLYLSLFLISTQTQEMLRQNSVLCYSCILAFWTLCILHFWSWNVFSVRLLDPQFFFCFTTLYIFHVKIDSYAL